MSKNGAMLPADAARVLGKPPMWVMLGLRQGRLPIGAAVLGEGGRWSYDVRPERLAQYMGISTDELWSRIEKEETA
jgi:hypothetical protein